MKQGELAPEIVPDFYRLTQPDCAAMDDATVMAHYNEWGKLEGRCGSPACIRAGFIAQLSPKLSTLEIGPAVRPSLVGSNVEYFEVTDRAGLIERAELEGYPADRCPSQIHHVSPTGDLGVIKKTFDVVFSSHCIEHQPDLIRHLNQAAKILKNHGKYFLIIPDKRYCFDAFIPVTRLSAVIAAHEQSRVVHTYEDVIEHYTMTTHNDGPRHWNGDHYDLSLFQQLEQRADYAEAVYQKANGGYVDVHAWQFTPESFRGLIDSLKVRGLINLSVDKVYNTVRNSIEFCAVLKVDR